MSEIIPAILARTDEDFLLELRAIPPGIPLIHIDVLEKDEWIEMSRPFEAHLMVARPEAIAERWIERGAKRLIVHTLPEEILALRGKVEIGLGVEMKIPLEDIFPLVEKVDFVQLMSIDEIGSQGHPLDGKIFDRIKQFKEKFPNVLLSIDGGVNVTNYQSLSDSGADRLVVGSGFTDLWQSLTKKE